MKQKTKKQHTSPYTPDPLFTAVTKSLPATLGFAVLAVALGDPVHPPSGRHNPRFP